MVENNYIQRGPMIRMTTLFPETIEAEENGMISVNC